MCWPFFGLLMCFLLVQSQAEKVSRDTDSSRHEVHDCRQTGCKGFDLGDVHSSHHELLGEDRVVLKVNTAEASGVHAVVRVCAEGVNAPECLGGLTTQVTLQGEPVFGNNAPGNASHTPRNHFLAIMLPEAQDVIELREHLICMAILVSSCFIFWCWMSLGVVIFGFWVTDQIVQWGNLVPCSRPMHDWLLGTYVCMCALRLAFRVADSYLGIQSGLPWYLRRSKKWGPLPPICLAALVLVPLPFITCWSVLGLIWLNDVLQNYPEGLSNSNGHPQVLAIVACLIVNALGVLSGLVFVLYAWLASHSFAVGGETLNAISDADFVQRWGLPQPMLAEDFGSGLDPEDIVSLPCDEVLADSVESCTSSCAICLTNFARRDRIRRLPNCKHEFHRPCIDQWLLRMPSCPLCLAPVAGVSRCSSSSSAEVVQVSQSSTAGTSSHDSCEVV